MIFICYGTILETVKVLANGGLRFESCTNFIFMQIMNFLKQWLHPDFGIFSSLFSSFSSLLCIVIVKFSTPRAP